MKFILSLLLASGLTSFNVFAGQNDTFVQCNTCSNEAQFSNIARHYGEQSFTATSRSNIVWVYDGQDNIKKYEVEMLFGEPGLGSEVVVTPRGLTNQEVSTAETIKENHRLVSLFSFGYGREVPQSIADSAWDMAGSSLTTNNVISHWQENADLIDLVGSYAGSILLLAGKIVNVNVYLTFSFSDGSWANFSIVGIGQQAVIVLQLDSAFDANGQTIPLTSSQAEALGEFILNNNSQFAEAAAAMTRLNFVVPPLPNGGQTLTCSMKCQGDECTLTCSSQ